MLLLVLVAVVVVVLLLLLLLLLVAAAAAMIMMPQVFSCVHARYEYSATSRTNHVRRCRYFHITAPLQKRSASACRQGCCQ